MKRKPKKIEFVKMHGAGNDYIYVDLFREKVAAPAALARKISDRHTGAGSDGLILIAPPKKKGAAAEMRMYNPDGSRSAMCGNGLRCVARYVYDAGYAKGREMLLESDGRRYPARIVGGKRVKVNLGPPEFATTRIPVRLPGPEAVKAPLKVGDKTFRITCVSMGNPHAVIFVRKATDELVLGYGPKIERHRAFPERTNVEFVEVLSKSRVRQRTWERGAGETLACGSGAAAVCCAGVKTGRTNRKLKIELLGGVLDLEWRAADSHVLMTGPAEYVYRGTWPY